MGIVILAENQIYQFLVLIDQRKAVNLMVPNNVIRFFSVVSSCAYTRSSNLVMKALTLVSGVILLTL